jgi:hypothetical protein
MFLIVDVLARFANEETMFLFIIFVCLMFLLIVLLEVIAAFRRLIGLIKDFIKDRRKDKDEN